MSKKPRSIRLYEHEWNYIEMFQTQNALPDLTKSISRILIEHEIMLKIFSKGIQIKEKQIEVEINKDISIKGEFDFN